MAVLADSAQEEIDASGGQDLLLIVVALLLEVLGIAVENVDVFCRYIDVVEEVAVHKGVVALRMLYRKSHILVHVEGDDVLEGDLSGVIHLDEFLVGAYRGGTCGESEHERSFGNLCLGPDGLCDVLCGPD